MLPSGPHRELLRKIYGLSIIFQLIFLVIFVFSDHYTGVTICVLWICIFLALLKWLADNEEEP